MFRVKYIFYLLLSIITPSSFGQQKENEQLFYTSIEELAKSKYQNQINFNKAIKYFIEKNNDSTLIYCNRQLVENNKIPEVNDYCHYFRMKSFKNKKLYKEALKESNIVSEKFKYYNDLQIAIGQLYLELYQFKKALSYFLKVEKSQSQNLLDLADLNENIGVCYLHLKNYNDSEKYLLKSSEILNLEKEEDKLYYNSTNLANLYYEQYKDKEAIFYFEKAYLISKESKNYSKKKSAANNMAVVEENRKNFEKALIFRKEAEKWNDSLTDQNKIWAVADVEKKFAITQKEKEIRVLEVENEIKNTQRNGLFLVALLLLSMFGIGFYFYRQKIKTNKIILAQKDNLDELNATKDKLFSIVSHDLRSSVNALKTSNTKLLSNLETKNYAELDVLLHKNNAIANSSYNLLDNLLNWAQQQTNQLFFQKESLHLHSIVQQVEYNYKPLASNKNIELINKVEKNVFVFMDLDSLKIIMRNILDNALKFSKEKGTISIYTQNSETDFIQLVIEDSGIGMSANVIQELLQKNMQLSKKNNKEIIGTGLGMQLCKSMIAKNEGKLDIESKEGLGTKIILFLPKDKANG
ncbi:tetratricopeptide repeat-containing sensor histidine kinase [Flavobacterium sp.]|uniref:tetratricopeptide repeat-containing sensor histidine kinase n=1 Tax=Flavobacterium sp. TaxID=239 RepID=UPI00286D7F13|nr:tetratricopeptide repeat-containing sensor histidine kinase [Flavobacterium sp.]